MGAGLMTPSVPLSFYAQLLPLSKPLLLLPTPHPSPLPPNKNFGRRLNPGGGSFNQQGEGGSVLAKIQHPQKVKIFLFANLKK